MGSEVPYETDLIRPLKYVVPVIFVLSIWGLCAVQERLARSIKPEYFVTFVSVLVGLVFVVYVHRKDSHTAHFVYPTIQAWMHGNLLPEQPITQLVHVEAIRAVRDFTPEKSKVFVASAFALQVRYAALRPVVYAFKDGWFFTMSNYDALLKWYDTYKKLGTISKTGYSPTEVKQTLIPIAKELNADYILVYFGSYFARIKTNTGYGVKLTSTANLMTSSVSSNGSDPISNQGPHHIDLDGLTRVWSNRQYGLYKLVK